VHEDDPPGRGSGAATTDADALDVVLVGDYDDDYPREKVLRRGFDLAGATVHECRFSDSARFPGPVTLLLLPLFVLRVVRRVLALRDAGVTPDLVVLTKFNPLVLPVAWLYARLAGCPLVYDLFVSLHRTAEMRGVHPLVVRAVHAVERVVYRLPDHLLVGTDEFADLYAELYGVPRDRFVRLPPGADEDWFSPRDDPRRDRFTLLYWGNFLPHHGVGTILGAAAELRDEPYEFVLLGDGPERERYERMADDLALSNVRFEGFVARETQQEWIAASHVALGVFADDPRSLASVTNKVSEAVASRRAVLTEASPAIDAWFDHGESVYTVPPADPVALAAAVRTLAADPDLVERVAAGGHEVYEAAFSTERVAAILRARLLDPSAA
jgi:glycosyltransferase involved in cell wall biosynthesis